MSLKYIREFIKNRIHELDSDFKEHYDAFNTDNIGENNLDKAYHVFYASMNNIKVDQATSSDEVSVTLSLFTETVRDDQNQPTLDDAFDFANKLRMTMIHPKNLNGQNFIKQVKFSSMQGENLTGNDNAIVIKLNLKFYVIYGLGVDLTCDC